MTAVEPEPTTEQPTSRRNFLRFGAFGAAAAAAAGVAGVVGAGEANAANGSNFLIGSSANSASADTVLTGGSTLWVQNGTSEASASLYGTAGGATGSFYGVRGASSSGVGVGVLGESTWGGTTGGGIGVRGTAGTNAQNVGVVAHHGGGGTALYASSASGTAASVVSTSGTGLLIGSGTGPAIRISPTGAASMPPTTGFWPVGSLTVKDGALWYCYSGGAGTTSKWSRISGAINLLPTPKRAYDSRTAGTGTKFGINTERVISLSTANTALPVGIYAVFLCLTVLSTEGSGYITAFQNGTTFSRSRSLSWYASKQTLTSSTITRVDAQSKIKIHSGGKTHLLIDVVGFMP